MISQLGRILRNDPSLYGVEVKEETLAGRIRARQLRAIYEARMIEQVRDLADSA